MTNLTHKNNQYTRFTLTITLCLVSVLLLSGYPLVHAQSVPVSTTLIRRMYTATWGVANPVGVAYSAHKDWLFAAENRSGETQTTLAIFTPYSDLISRLTIDFALEDAINLTYDESAHRLLLLNGKSNQLAIVAADAQGTPDPTRLTQLSVADWGLVQPAGMGVDATAQRLWILDAATAKLLLIPLQGGLDADVAVERALDLSFLGESGLGESGLGGSGLRGVAVHPTNGHLFVQSSSEQMVYELNDQGQLLKRYDVANPDLMIGNGLLLMTSTDSTDAPETVHLLIAESNPEYVSDRVNAIFLPWMSAPAKSSLQGSAVEESATTDETLEALTTPGSIVEVTLETISPPVIAAAVQPMRLVQTILTSAFSPSSPDPSGVGYIPGPNATTPGHLFIGDGEVDEMPIYRGANLFETTLNGTVVRTATTVGFSNEPTGVDFNGATGRLLISDDDQREIFDIDRGPDALFGTADDIRTHFDTLIFGSNDPEGVATDPRTGHIFIADGVSSEIYHLDPGVDGHYTTGEPVTHFDTLSLGVADPEGIEVNEVGNLLLVGNDQTQMYEVSQTGGLVRTYDISAARSRQVAGVAMAPSSLSATVNDFYIVDRAVDNDTLATENDGKLYEFTQDFSLPTPTPAPALPHVRDEFTVISYNNNHGNRPWSGPWSESEANGPTTGNMVVVANADCPNSPCMQVRARVVASTIFREASLTGTSAILTFDINNRLDGNDQVVVEVSSNGGVSYTLLQTYRRTNRGIRSERFDISSFISANTRVRFRVVARDKDKRLNVDNVQIVFN